MSKERAQYLEWATYAAQRESVRVTPGVSLTLDDEAIVITSLFPMPDANHACLLRATDDAVGPLLDKIVRRFRRSPMPARVFVSPACEPPNLAERLLAHGFEEKEDEEEAWMVLDLETYKTRSYPPGTTVEAVGRANLWRWCKAFAIAFDLGVAFAPFMYLMMWPSAASAHPCSRRYLATRDDGIVAVCSVLHWQDVVTLGGFGVMPKYRGSRTAFILATEVIKIAQREGKKDLLLQTTSHKLERYLKIQGFEAQFRRQCYIQKQTQNA